MPSTAEIADALLVWVRDAVPEIESEGSWHDYPHTSDPGDFPDVAVEFSAISTIDDPMLGHRPRKQVTASLSILVNYEPHRDSAHWLWSMADRLIASQTLDRTLAMRLHGLPIESGPWAFTLPPVIAVWEDGTQGREMTGQAVLKIAGELT